MPTLPRVTTMPRPVGGAEARAFTSVDSRAWPRRVLTVPMAAMEAPGAHVVPMPDQVGWPGSKALIVPPNITHTPLQSKCPERNLGKNIWQFLRDNGLTNRTFRCLQVTSSTIVASPGTARRSALAHHVHRPFDVSRPAGTWPVCLPPPDTLGASQSARSTWHCK
jgi:hypothetical protein